MPARASRVLTMAAVTAALLARAHTAWACTCVPETTHGHVAKAAAVFVGVATRVDRAPERTTVSFDVEAVYKGSVPSTTTLGLSGGSRLADTCAPQFVPGKRYSVFVEPKTPQTTTTCAGTTESDTLRAAGLDPVAVYGALPRNRGNRFGAALAATILTVAVAAGVATRLRRRRSDGRATG